MSNVNIELHQNNCWDRAHYASYHKKIITLHVEKKEETQGRDLLFFSLLQHFAMVFLGHMIFFHPNIVVVLVFPHSHGLFVIVLLHIVQMNEAK